jgi:methylthioribose-1-phosphate isomerase
MQPFLKVYSMRNFFTLRTVAWQNDKVCLIDQTKLPRRLSYVRCRTYHDVAEAIRTMVVRGAPAIGVTGAMGMALAALESTATTRNSLLRDLERAQKTLDMTRPTAVNLSWATKRILDLAKSVEGEPETIVEAVIEEAKAMANEDVEINKKLGKNGAALLKDGDVVLTHCN